MNIYIDCTSILFTDLNTGIQRVERNLIASILRKSQKVGVNVQLVIIRSRCLYLKIDAITVDEFDVDTYMQELGYLEAINICLYDFLRLRRLIKTVIPCAKFKLWLDENWKGWKRWALLPPCLLLISLPVLVAIIYALLNPVSQGKKWQPKEGDIILVPGASWWLHSYIEKALNRIKSKGARVVVVICDILPLTQEKYKLKFVEEAIIKSFGHFSSVSRGSDLFVAISKATKQDILDYFIENDFQKKPAVEHFKLGVSLDRLDINIEPREQVKQFFSSPNNRPYICVGTIEPRKNHVFLLNAFDKLWESQPEKKLCLIGRKGWMVDDLVDRIERHPLYGESLLWFTDLNDSELHYCYTHAQSLVYPSLAEGFGLPLIEALNQKCQVMASDIPVFREIGQNYCKYFKLDDADGLAALLASTSADDSKDLAEFYWPTWDESALEFLAILRNQFSDH